MIDTKQLIKEAHKNAVERGFYDKCDCNEGYGYNCSLCNNETGVIQNKNIGELLMLCVSELGEALEAHRCKRFVMYDCIINGLFMHDEYTREMSLIFENSIKDTFEDEIADVFIRLFDLCAYFNIEIKPIKFPNAVNDGWSDNVGSNLFVIVGQLWNRDYSFVYSLLISLCEKYNIPIEKHIKAKMAYNRTRPHKHGKEY